MSFTFPRSLKAGRASFPIPGRAWIRAWSGAALLLMMGMIVTGCSDRGSIRAELQTLPSREHDPRRLIVQGQVTGPQAELSYRWFSQNGECIPQRSETPTTTFCFGEGTSTDRVVLEVWRGSKLVGRGEVAVKPKFADDAAAIEALRRPNIHIEITDTPPYDAKGGPDTRAHIGGNLTGDFDSAVIVVIYSRVSESWFVQPDLAGALHLLRSDHSFSTWTHTGTEYAVLVARPTFTPLTATESLPLSDSAVLAHIVVEGERK